MKLDWKDVDVCKPPENTLLMVSGDSGYRTYKQFLTLAYYDEAYRPSHGGRIRWQSVSNDSLSDQAWCPTHWAYPIKLPVAA